MIQENAITSNELDKIKITRGQKGTYGWEISVTGLDVTKLEKIDIALREKFTE